MRSDAPSCIYCKARRYEAIAFILSGPPPTNPRHELDR